MPSIAIIGVGSIGSRHLQALARYEMPLDVFAADPSPESLQVAKKRFEEETPKSPHRVEYLTELPGQPRAIDVAIIATTSRVRRAAVEALLTTHQVRFLILEKILFDQSRDYPAVQQLITASDSTAWVNCPMRMMPPYRDLRQRFRTRQIQYAVEGAFGLMTTTIHYLDHVAFLTGVTDFTFDIAGLDPNPVPSKRTGFWERTGTLRARGSDGSTIKITSTPGAGAPVIEISSDNTRITLREETLHLPLQSEMTADVVRELLERGSCPLTPLGDSVKLHLAYLQHFPEPYPYT